MTTQIVLTCHYDDHRAATLYMGDGGESPLTPFHLGVGGDICTNGYYIDVSKSFYAYFFNEEKEKSKGQQRRIKLPRLYKYIHLNEIKICITVTGWIPLNKSKITLKAFTRQNKFKTLQGVFDKIMKHELKSMIAQVPSICIQTLGISKKNFLPTTEMPQRTNSFFDKLKRNKSQKAMTELDLQKKEGIKLMFGKDFK